MSEAKKQSQTEKLAGVLETIVLKFKKELDALGTVTFDKKAPKLLVSRPLAAGEVRAAAEKDFEGVVRRLLFNEARWPEIKQFVVTEVK